MRTLVKSSEGELSQWESLETCSWPHVVCGSRQNGEALSYSGSYFTDAEGNYKDIPLKRCFHTVVTSPALSKCVTMVRTFCIHAELRTTLKYNYSIINNGITTLMGIFSSQTQWHSLPNLKKLIFRVYLQILKR